MTEINFTEVVARKKLGATDAWLLFAWECVNDDRNSDLIVTGGVPIGTYARGPRKGRPKWDRKTADRVVVTHAEEQQARLDYERSTGQCSRCSGERQEWAGWSAAEGNRFRPCRRCGATGNAPAVAVVL